MNRLRVAGELIDLGRHADAARTIADALAVEPDSAQALATLAYLHHRTGDNPAMLDAAERAVAADPANPWAVRLLALALLGAERPERARAVVDRAVDLDPEQPQSYHLRAHVLTRLGDLVPAYLAARQTVALAPQDPDSYLTLSHVLVNAGEFAAARAADRTALRLAPHTPGPLRAHAEAAFRAGRFRTAVRAYRSLLGSHPTEAGLSRAFESVMDWWQGVWAGLAGLVAGTAAVMRLAGVGTGPRAAVTAALLAVWAAGYGWAHRGLGEALRAYARTREPGHEHRRRPRAAVVAVLVPVLAAALVGFVDVPLLPLVLVLLNVAIAMVLPLGYAILHARIRLRGRRARRAFRAEIGAPA